MQYNQPYGVSDPNAPYINGNPSTGTQGSIPPAASIEYPQREIANLITDGGFVPSNGDLRQVGRSLQSGHIWFGIDTGVANAVQCNLAPPPLTYYDGMFVWVVANATNTGPSTIQLNGLSATRIIRRGGGDVLSGDLLQGYRTLLCYNAALQNFELYGINFAGGQTGYLPILTQNTNLYVNGTTGSDTLYDGSSATVVGSTAPKAGPFKTIGKAMNTTFTFGPSVYTMTINIAAGTYPEAVITAGIPGPGTILKGVGQTTVITGATGKYTITCNGPNSLTCQNLLANNAYPISGSTSTIFSCNQGTLTCTGCFSGNTPNYVFSAYPYGHINVMGSHTFQTGSSVPSAVFIANNGSTINVAQFGLPTTLTFAGALNMGSGYFALAQENSVIEFYNSSYLTFVNASNVTGAKYFCVLNGVIQTGNSGASYLPGTIAGSTASGGQYS
jgi:hypothetical protein